MVVWLRALAVLPEDPDSTSQTHIVAHNHPVPGVIPRKHQAHKWHKHTYKQAKHHTHETEINTSFLNGLILKKHLVGILSSFMFGF